MSGWKDVMRAAEAAKGAMLSDRSEGEKEFELLLRQHPRDGMVYFKRGEAREALGESAQAAEDFRRDTAFFPMAEWKRRAREALERVSHPSASHREPSRS